MDPAISKLQKAFQEYGDVITAERAIDSANFRKENEMPKHTPGPWSRNIKPAKKYNTIFAGRNIHICHLETTGLTDEEIEELTAHATQDRFVYYHHWRPGDVLMWDERATMHRGAGDYSPEQRRVMLRTIVYAN